MCDVTKSLVGLTTREFWCKKNNALMMRGQNPDTEQLQGNGSLQVGNIAIASPDLIHDILRCVLAPRSKLCIHLVCVLTLLDDLALKITNHGDDLANWRSGAHRSE